MGCRYLTTLWEHATDLAGADLEALRLETGVGADHPPGPAGPGPHRVNRPGFDGGSDDTEGSLSWDSRKYPDELRERATRMTLEALADPARAKGAIRRIADELGVHPEALRTWVKKAQINQGTRPGTTTDQAQRIKELDKEVRELRRANAILKSTVGLSVAAECERSARPVDLPVRRDQEGGVWGLADLQGAHWRRSQDRPEHLLRSQDPSPISQERARRGPQGGDIQGPQEPATRFWGPARCTRYGAGPKLPSVTVLVTWPGAPSNASWVTWACAASDAPSPRAARRESSARPTWSGATSRRLPRVGCGSSTFPRKREVPPPMYAPSLGGSMWLS